jgi:hypothetical protein
MRTRLPSPPMRPRSLALWWGNLVAAALIAAETVAVDPLAGGQASRAATVKG